MKIDAYAEVSRLLLENGREVIGFVFSPSFVRELNLKMFVKIPEQVGDIECWGRPVVVTEDGPDMLSIAVNRTDCVWNLP